MEPAPPLLAFGKLLLTFAVILALLRLRVTLWLTILAGAVVVALTCGVSPADWPGLLTTVLGQQDFLIISLMIFLIILLSSVQEATGQSRLLVEGLEQHLRRPRIRLVLFPSLIGLLPMPGGALFSCPMVKVAAKDMDLSEQKKALINYWFRHIWELAWPLYPGYVLTCALLHIPLSRLWQCTFPLVPMAFAAGWFFIMRDVVPPHKPDNADEYSPDASYSAPLSDQTAPRRARNTAPPLREVLLHALPLGVTLFGAVVFTFLFSAFLPGVPSQLCFSLALLCAILTSLWQGRGRRERSLFSLAFTATTGKILILLYVIFVFKNTLVASGLVRSLGDLGASNLTVVLSFILLPFVCGLLTGIMVGFVGVSFPILLGLLQHSSLQEYSVPLVILGLAAGNAGQLLSPLHVCLVVTCEYFPSNLSGILRILLVPVIVLFVGAALWALTALALGITL